MLMLGTEQDFHRAERDGLSRVGTGIRCYTWRRGGKRAWGRLEWLEPCPEDAESE